MEERAFIEEVAAHAHEDRAAGNAYLAAVSVPGKRECGAESCGFVKRVGVVRDQDYRRARGDLSCASKRPSKIGTTDVPVVDIWNLRGTGVAV